MPSDDQLLTPGGPSGALVTVIALFVALACGGAIAFYVGQGNLGSPNSGGQPVAYNPSTTGYTDTTTDPYGDTSTAPSATTTNTDTQQSTTDTATSATNTSTDADTGTTPTGTTATTDTSTQTTATNASAQLTPLGGSGHSFALSVPNQWQDFTNSTNLVIVSEHGVSSDCPKYYTCKQLLDQPYVLVSETPGSEASAQSDAMRVRSTLDHQASYVQNEFGPAQIGGNSAWTLNFNAAGVQQADSFVHACGNAYAVLVSAPAAEFAAEQALFDQITSTFAVSC